MNVNYALTFMTNVEPWTYPSRPAAWNVEAIRRFFSAVSSSSNELRLDHLAAGDRIHFGRIRCDARDRLGEPVIVGRQRVHRGLEVGLEVLDDAPHAV